MSLFKINVNNLSLVFMFIRFTQTLIGSKSKTGTSFIEYLISCTNQEESRRLKNMYTEAIVIAGRLAVLKP